MLLEVALKPPSVISISVGGLDRTRANRSGFIRFNRNFVAPTVLTNTKPPSEELLTGTATFCDAGTAVPGEPEFETPGLDTNGFSFHCFPPTVKVIKPLLFLKKFETGKNEAGFADVGCMGENFIAEGADLTAKVPTCVGFVRLVGFVNW